VSRSVDQGRQLAGSKASYDPDRTRRGRLGGQARDSRDLNQQSRSDYAADPRREMERQLELIKVCGG